MIDVLSRSIVRRPSGVVETTTIERHANARVMKSAVSGVRYEVHDSSGRQCYERYEEITCNPMSWQRRHLASQTQERIARQIEEQP